jgi:hypothetical protein
MRGGRFRWFGWWYAAIAAGFALLAINRALVGEKLWLVGVRVVISLGFALLAYMEFSGLGRGK